jgi:hypothetical protein
MKLIFRFYTSYSRQSSGIFRLWPRLADNSAFYPRHHPLRRDEKGRPAALRACGNESG